MGYFYKKYNFKLTVTDGAAHTINVPLPHVMELDGEFLNAVEVALNVTAATGAGVSPTLVVKVQSSMESDFATAGLIKDVLTMSTATDATTEVKAVRFSDNQTTTSNTIFSGIYRRLNLVADAASGAKVFEATVHVLFYRA